jgi:hypothetical protein
MRKLYKEIDFSSICPDFLTNLERLHYEVLTKERILAMTLANSTTGLSAMFDEYYKEYSEAFKEYETKKDEFYRTYLSQHVLPSSVSWEVNFLTSTVSIYE